MSEPWAAIFYNSPAWKRTRKAYGNSVFWVCERCGEPGKIIHHRVWLTRRNINNPAITLSWSNLECLCQECHNSEHFPVTPATREGFAFDDNGDLVPTT